MPGYGDLHLAILRLTRSTASCKFICFSSLHAQCASDIFSRIRFGLGFLIVEILVPLIIVFLVLTPLKTIIKNLLAISFSILAQVVGSTVSLCEHFVSTAQWAGEGGAWIVVMLLPLAICTPVGYSLFGIVGIAGGAAAGSAVGGYIAFERGGDFFEGPGPKRIFTLWTVIVAIFTIMTLVIEFGSQVQNGL